MFLAEVTAVQVDEKYMDETGKFELNKTGLLVYSHGEYLGLGEKLGTFGYSVRKKSVRAIVRSKGGSGSLGKRSGAKTGKAGR